MRVSELHEEAARDLVRAREDARGGHMRVRQRLSKLLLRHGLAYEGSAWTLAHDVWLRRRHFASCPSHPSSGYTLAGTAVAAGAGSYAQSGSSASGSPVAA